ncbi:Thiamin pyrophosphokinase catalytic region [Beutenbergia cavernae DSM 12333]|uniref:Thiamin pyrophosphokinase catalytic region n=1 Tax=Beutenbergia cavernae (strain ATCC BAA-8 / DSM 12333 / CCUG 43141 / JCM 11478 / NBRC 16432 / NCIMB 13614 / HKI 0122) TaxID=471853 RepID=C5BW03_BEUC1|nr:putative cytokinetic ring protein SteA [Beutenbergia cavernae]ACQ80604.1 Thiamin pyrophosphokinase catalytic region [Beutenbergia cavernae DSM 12333]
MRSLLPRRRAATDARAGAQVERGQITGPARVDRSTKTLTKRLRPGDVAVIDHVDIDRVSAEALVGCKPAAVLNAARSTSGRYPNLGPEILLEAGIPLLDDLGSDVMAIPESSRVEVDGAKVSVGGHFVAEGTVQTTETVEVSLAEAREGLADQLESFAANTMDYLRRERELLLDGVGVPKIRTKLEGRQALIVVRGYHYKEDLAMLRSYVRENRPVLIGVDGGADAILDAGWTPDMIVGDMDSVSDRALGCGAEVVVHAYRDGRAPGLSRVERLGVSHVVFPATGTSEDVAMLLADDKGAELIVAVGTHATLVEFLDKGRAGMASTFLTRLRVGSKLVDAKGVSRLYRHRISNWQVTALVLAGLAAVLVALGSTPAGQTLFGLILARIDDFVSFVRDLLGLTAGAVG